MSASGNQVNQRSEWLLAELDNLASDRLPNEARQRLRRRVEAQIKSAVQHRVKGGMPHSEAELDTIASFGAPESFLAHYIHARERYYEKVNYRPSREADSGNNQLPDEIYAAGFWVIGLAGIAWLFFLEGVEVLPLMVFAGGLLLLPLAVIKFRVQKELSGIYLALAVLACLMLTLGFLVGASNRVG